MTDMQIRLSDLQLQVTSIDTQHILALPKHSPELAHIAHLLLQVVRHVPATGKENKRDLDRSGDVFDDLENEFANDKVGDQVAMQFDLQDMVAHSLIDTILAEDGVGTVTASTDDLIELAYWFNRRRHVLVTAADGNRESEAFELALTCGVWSQQLLEAAA